MEYGRYFYQGSVLHEPFYNGIGLKNYSAFWNRQKSNTDHVRRLGLLRRLPVHEGCVNSIEWNENGTLLLSGSDDHRLVITDPFARKVLSNIASGHRANIFAASFFPLSNDNRIVSCCGAGEIRYTIVDRPDSHGSGNFMFDCHMGTTYNVVTVPSEPHVFLSCGEDSTVRVFDLRIKNGCSKRNCQDDILIRLHKGVTSISVSPSFSYLLATGSADSVVRIFDRRMIAAPRSQGDFSTLGVTCQFKPTSMHVEASSPVNYPITCVKFAPDGEEVLVSYSGDHLYLFNTKQTINVDELKPMSPNYEHQRGSSQSVKRLRLRGDWSDTGPLARPESERQNRLPASIEEEREQRFYATMQRVSDMLTNWLVNYMNRQSSPPSNNETDSNQAGPSEPNQIQPPPSLPASLLPVAGLLGVRVPSSPTIRQEIEEESGGDSSPASCRRPSTTSSSDDGDQDAQRRNEAALTMQRMFRRKAREKRRQLREWNEIAHCRQLRQFTGHRSVRTMIKEANFWGDRHIISGSDCGNVFMWDRESTEVVNVLEADKHVVNCVQPHPSLPLLASSGIDYDVKLFAPILQQQDTESIAERISEFSRRNAVMLEESRDTLTVPASFMLRVLAAFNYLNSATAPSSSPTDD